MQRVIGVFSVDRVEEGRADEIWERCGRLGAIEVEDYDRYYLRAPSAFAIHIEKVWHFQEPIELRDIGVEHVPQSYSYLPERAVSVLAARAMDEFPLRRRGPALAVSAV